jgi:hypothetical protein
MKMLRINRPCDTVGPGAPCPTHDNGTWPEDCICYQEGQPGSWLRLIRRSEKTMLTAFYVFGLCLLTAVLVLMFLLMPAALAAPSCLTKSEARENWPRAHLYWHGRSRCWDNRRGGSRHYIRKLPSDALIIRAQVIPSLVDPLIKNEMDEQADVEPFVIIFFPVDERLNFITWEYRVSGPFQ